SKLSLESITVLRKRCIDFTVQLSKEFQHRLPVNVKTLQMMSVLSAEEVLKANKGTREIIELAQLFGFDLDTTDRIVTQWRNVHFTRWENTPQTVAVWAEVCDAGNANPFADLCSLAIVVLSLPHSNAEVERLFSMMNIVKSNLRNRMGVNTLNAILRVTMGLKLFGECCCTYNLPDSITKLTGTTAAYSFKKKQPFHSTEQVESSTSKYCT
ncbi:UNVERIFIED_CONTAM: hypothetical protein FKN15_049877, partial [Acipenser sinensis]